MPSLLSVALFALVASSDAFRQARQQGSKGMVDLLYLYGAPSCATPALTNFSRCFAGKRVVNVKKVLIGKRYDIVTGAGRKLGYSNAMMDLQEIDVKSQKIKNTRCSAEATQQPTGIWEAELHRKEVYAANIESANIPEVEKAYGFFAEVCAFNQDENEVRGLVESKGWNLVDSAHHQGGVIIGGPQVVHLMQHPSTLDCVVTFQGSSSIKDWLANAGGKKTEFCGRSEKVHDGLKYSLELSTGSDAFQTLIRPKLGKCRRVIAVGQSQGAAQAEMFAACVNQAPNSAALYKQMSWQKESPARL